MPKIHRDRPPTSRYDADLGRYVSIPIESAPVPSPPSRRASKAEWVAYAQALGVDSSGTKAQIIRRMT